MSVISFIISYLLVAYGLWISWFYAFDKKQKIYVWVEALKIILLQLVMEMMRRNLINTGPLTFI